MFDGKLENSELKGCTKLEKIENIKEIPAPGILIFGTLCVVFMHGMDQSDRFCSVYDKFCNNNNDR